VDLPPFTVCALAFARMRAMRRWLFVLLLWVLPTQFVWASVAPYCAHETNIHAKQHFGHHEHQHQSGTAATPDDERAPVSGGIDHPDCGSCHFGCSVTLPGSNLAIGTLSPGQANPAADPPDTSHIPAGPDRPDRADHSPAVRFGCGVVFGHFTS
jgi:hypothetical protein